MASDRSPSTNTKLLAEFLGTFILTFVVGLNLTECDPRTGFGPIACGCALMVLVYAFGPISGGHLNPAVTFSILLQDGFAASEEEPQWQQALKYVIAQCAGGALAGLASGFMVGFEKSGASLGPDSAEILLGAPLGEFLYTFLLCFTVLNVAVAHNQLSEKDEKNESAEKPAGYGVAIGFVLIAAKGVAAVSGAALNPAVTLGINFMGPNWKTLYLPVYVAFQLAGGFAATTALHMVRPESKKHKVDLGAPSWFTAKAYQFEELFDPEDTAEFLGTFFIGLTISLNAMLPDNPGAIWSVGACFMVMIYSLGPVSGGVFNPALTLAFSLRWYGTGEGFGEEKLTDPAKSFKEWIKYFIHQLVGAAAGTGCTLLIYLLAEKGYPIPEVQPACTYDKANPLSMDPEKCTRHTDGQAFFAECFGTFFLCFVVLSIAEKSVSAHLQHYGAFVVGSCIIAAGYSFGSISGGLLNPAVTLCNSVGTFQIFTSPLPIVYIGAQCLGGVLAGGVFRLVTHPHEMPLEAPSTSEQPLLA